MNRCRFGKVLAELLESREISGRELGRLSGLPESSVSHYMIGKQVPSRSAIKRMAKALQVPVELLIWFAHTDKNNSALFREVESIMQKY